MNRQYQYFTHFPLPPTVVDNSYTYASEQRCLFTEAETLKRGKAVIGRLRQTDDLIWDIDSHSEDLSKESIVELWESYCATEARKLALFCSDWNIPIIFFDSGRGIHANIKSDSMREFAEEHRLDCPKLQLHVARIINDAAGMDKGHLIVMERLHGSMRHSVVRACGAWNKKAQCFKTAITDLDKKQFVTDARDVVYPATWNKWNIPEKVLEKAMEELKEEEQRITEFEKNRIEYDGEHLALPCSQNLLNTQRLPQLRRNKLAFVLAYRALVDFNGNEEKTKTLLKKYSKNIGKPSHNAYGWIDYIRRKGIENSSVSCGAIVNAEKEYSGLGYDVVFCERHRCPIWKGEHEKWLQTEKGKQHTEYKQKIRRAAKNIKRGLKW